MSRISFTLAIEPQSLQTSGKRLCIVAGRPRFFRSKEAEAFRRNVTALCLPHRPAAPLNGPLHVELTFVLPRPGRLDSRRYPDARIPCDRRPDTSNLVKAFEDILTEARFWHDDGQLARHTLEKHYAARGESPCIEVAIEPLYPDLHAQAVLTL